MTFSEYEIFGVEETTMAKVTMKRGHLYRRGDGGVFLQAIQKEVSWEGDDRVCRHDDGSLYFAPPRFGLNAVEDLGPAPTWADVVEMREEVERLRADLQSMAANRDDLLQRNTELEAENANLRAKLAKEADRPLAVGDVVVCVEDGGFSSMVEVIEGRTYRVRKLREGGKDIYCDGVKMSHRASRFRRATPAEVAEFERRERGDEPLKMEWTASAHRVRQAAKEFSESISPSNHVDLTNHKIPPIPVGRRLVTDYAEEPHPEAESAFGGEWVKRVHTDEPYCRGYQYTVLLAYDTPIPWHGGPCPVAEWTEVAVEFRDGEIELWMAGEIGWGHRGVASDIVSYTVPAPKPTEPDLDAVEKRDMLRDMASEPAWNERPTGGESVVFATRGMEVADVR